MVLGAALACAGSAGSAGAAEREPVAATANGNAFAGGLSFAPAKATLAVGQVIRWTNTDVIAPHTVTEDHGLFDLVGNDVNGTPASPSGFGPGTTVELAAPAGTIAYFCRVHPGDMNGVLDVPVTLERGPGLAKPKRKARTPRGRQRQATRRRAFRRTVTATWAPAAPAAGQVFDVEARTGQGPWRAIETSTVKTGTTFKAGRAGTVTSVRARLRRADVPKDATGWSPEATVTG